MNKVKKVGRRRQPISHKPCDRQAGTKSSGDGLEVNTGRGTDHSDKPGSLSSQRLDLNTPLLARLQGYLQAAPKQEVPETTLALEHNLTTTRNPTGETSAEHFHPKLDASVVNPSSQSKEVTSVTNPTHEGSVTSSSSECSLPGSELTSATPGQQDTSAEKALDSVIQTTGESAKTGEQDMGMTPSSPKQDVDRDQDSSDQSSSTHEPVAEVGDSASVQATDVPTNIESTNKTNPEEDIQSVTTESTSVTVSEFSQDTCGDHPVSVELNLENSALANSNLEISASLDNAFVMDSSSLVSSSDVASSVASETDLVKNRDPVTMQCETVLDTSCKTDMNLNKIANVGSVSECSTADPVLKTIPLVDASCLTDSNALKDLANCSLAENTGKMDKALCDPICFIEAECVPNKAVQDDVVPAIDDPKGRHELEEPLPTKIDSKSASSSSGPTNHGTGDRAKRKQKLDDVSNKRHKKMTSHLQKVQPQVNVKSKLSTTIPSKSQKLQTETVKRNKVSHTISSKSEKVSSRNNSKNKAFKVPSQSQNKTTPSNQTTTSVTHPADVATVTVAQSDVEVTQSLPVPVNTQEDNVSKLDVGIDSPDERHLLDDLELPFDDTDSAVKPSLPAAVDSGLPTAAGSKDEETLSSPHTSLRQYSPQDAAIKSITEEPAALPLGVDSLVLPFDEDEPAKADSTQKPKGRQQRHVIQATEVITPESVDSKSVTSAESDTTLTTDLNIPSLTETKASNKGRGKRRGRRSGIFSVSHLSETTQDDSVCNEAPQQLKKHWQKRRGSLIYSAADDMQQTNTDVTELAPKDNLQNTVLNQKLLADFTDDGTDVHESVHESSSVHEAKHQVMADSKDGNKNSDVNSMDRQNNKRKNDDLDSSLTKDSAAISHTRKKMRDDSPELPEDPKSVASESDNSLSISKMQNDGRGIQPNNAANSVDMDKKCAPEDDNQSTNHSENISLTLGEASSEFLPEEAKDILDTLTLPFDDEDKEQVSNKKKTSGKKRGKKPRSKVVEAVEPEVTAENLSLQFDDDPPQKSPAEVVTKPKKKRGRRSADFEIMNNAVPTSPAEPSDSSPGQAEYLPMGLPGVRRSSRVRRKSLEIYRATKNKEKELEEAQTDSAECTEQEQKLVASPQTSVTEEKSQTTSSEVTCDEDTKSDNIFVENKSDLCSEEHVVDLCDLASSSNEQTSPSTDQAPSEEDDGSKQGRRKQRTPKAPVAKTVVAAQPKGRRGKKNSNEPTVEEIYLNKLWRNQMPKLKTWETIFEKPVVKQKQEQYQSAKKFKRNINFEEFYAKNRLKKRRQKALKHGWKPLPLKQDAKAAELLKSKLAVLESELDLIDESQEEQVMEGLDTDSILNQSSDMSRTSDSVLTTKQDEEIFYTPVKHLDSQEEADIGTEGPTGVDDCADVSFCSESSCESQAFKTPMKDLLDFA